MLKLNRQSVIMVPVQSVIMPDSARYSTGMWYCSYCCLIAACCMWHVHHASWHVIIEDNNSSKQQSKSNKQQTTRQLNNNIANLTSNSRFRACCWSLILMFFCRMGMYAATNFNLKFVFALCIYFIFIYLLLLNLFSVFFSFSFAICVCVCHITHNAQCVHKTQDTIDNSTTRKTKNAHTHASTRHTHTCHVRYCPWLYHRVDKSGFFRFLCQEKILKSGF